MAIRTKLMPHQTLIVNFAKDKENSALFADYGTGKTLAALTIVSLNRARKILVVSSKTAIESTWPSEIEKHTDFRYSLLLGASPIKLKALSLGLRVSHLPESNYAAAHYRPVIFLINFDGIRNIYDSLAMASFDYLIVDESTKIKDPTTYRSKVLWALGRTVKRRMIMTGWPITENLVEIYSQIKFLDFGQTFGNSYYGFLNKYFYRAGFKWIARKGSEKKILTSIKPFTVRVTNDVLKLPPKVYEKKIIEPTEQQRKLLNDLETYFRVEFGKTKIDTQYIFVIINKALQICDGFLQSNWYNQKFEDKVICTNCKCVIMTENGIPSKCPKCRHSGYREIIECSKDDVIVDIVEDIDPKKNKVIIWAMFKFSVYKLEKLFQKLGYNVLTLTGDSDNVDMIIKKFQFSKQHNILVATQKKASESISLTACKYAVYYSNYWSADLRSNSEARIRRKGSEGHKSINYTDIILKGTIEEHVYSCLREKKNLIDRLKNIFQEK